MSFLKGLGAGEGGGGGNFLAKLFGTSPETMHGISNRIGMGANQIAQAGGAEAGYQPNGYIPQAQMGDPNNLFMRLFGGGRQFPRGLSGNITNAPSIASMGRAAPLPQRDLSLYGIGN